MKKIAIVSVMAALLGTTALADTSSMSTTATGMGVLENDYVKAGVNGTSGTFGSGGKHSSRTTSLIQHRFVEHFQQMAPKVRLSNTRFAI